MLFDLIVNGENLFLSSGSELGSSVSHVGISHVCDLCNSVVGPEGVLFEVGFVAVAFSSDLFETLLTLSGVKGGALFSLEL